MLKKKPKKPPKKPQQQQQQNHKKTKPKKLPSGNDTGKTSVMILMISSIEYLKRFQRTKILIFITVELFIPIITFIT